MQMYISDKKEGQLSLHTGQRDLVSNEGQFGAIYLVRELAAYKGALVDDCECDV